MDEWIKFHTSWIAGLERLRTDPAAAGRFILGLADYIKTGTAPELPGKEDILLAMAVADLDHDQAARQGKNEETKRREQEISEKRRQAALARYRRADPQGGPPGGETRPDPEPPHHDEPSTSPGDVPRDVCMQTDANACTCMQTPLYKNKNKSKNKNKTAEAEKETESESEPESAEETAAPFIAAPAPADAAPALSAAQHNDPVLSGPWELTYARAVNAGITDGAGGILTFRRDCAQLADGCTAAWADAAIDQCLRNRCRKWAYFASVMRGYHAAGGIDTWHMEDKPADPPGMPAGRGKSRHKDISTWNRDEWEAYWQTAPMPAWMEDIQLEPLGATASA